MKLRAGSGGGNRQQKMKVESQKQVLEREAVWKKWEAEGIQASYSYYHLRLPAKILPFHPVPFSSNHGKVVQREGSREHWGHVQTYFSTEVTPTFCLRTQH